MFLWRKTAKIEATVYYLMLIVNLTHLQTFISVASSGGFSAAAETMDVSKGLVSRHIQLLERELATRLFHRTTRRVSLTEAGEALLVQARQIQHLACQAELQIRDLTQECSGTLKITAPVELGRVLCRDIIPRFHNDFPKVDLVLDFDPDAKDIEAGEFDIALRAGEPLPDNVVARDFGIIRNVLVAAPAYLYSKDKIDCCDELSDASLILSCYRSEWNQLTLCNGVDRTTLDVKSSIYTNSYTSALELVLAGMGIASLPLYQVESQINASTLLRVLPAYSLPVHRLSLIYSGQRIMPRKIVMFNRYIMDWQKDHKHFFMDIDRCVTQD